MKKYKYILNFIILAVMIFSSTACEDVLETTPPGEFAPGNVLNNEEGITALLYSAYTFYNMQQGYKNEINMHEVSSDMAFNTGGGENRTLSLFINFTWDPSVGWLNQMWVQRYNSIRDANIVLDNIDNVADIEEDTRAMLIAEARYLRAAAYASLYNMFGRVPLMTSSLDGPKARATDDEMKSFIETELTEIVADLPNPGSELQYGRATKGHALGILTKHYLNTKNWGKVIETVDDIDALNYYRLFPDFEGLFRVENEPDKNPSNKEMMVAWPQINEVPYGNNFMNGATPPGFIRSDQVPGFLWTSAMANWATQYRLRDDFVNTFDTDNDDRFKLIIYNYYNANGDLIDLTTTPDNMRNLKYYDNNALANFGGVDYPIVRYADILLSHAEALNEINGPTQEGLDLINLVRARAKLDPITLSDASSKEVLRDMILDERGWEFVSEGKRREDLVRHGKYISRAQDRGIASAANHHVLYPIPQAEMNANLLLEGDQNPGY